MCATLWSMIGWPTRRREWSTERKLKAIAEAGFDGVSEMGSLELRAMLDPLGLRLMGKLDVGRTGEIRANLLAQREAGAHFVNVQLLDHDTPPEKAAQVAVRAVRESDALGMGVHIETHRDTATETPEKFEAIADLFARETGRVMPVTWDHSHFAVSKHVAPSAYIDRLLVWRDSIQASSVFHLRPFNGQHCQVPVRDERGRKTPEFRDYMVFVEELFATWMRGPMSGGELWVVPELGMTHGYHLSVHPHPWPDAVVAARAYRQAFAAAWRRVGKLRSRF
ncbi:hypothetical protein ASA1KI_15630 [Opitutales bacterium ASA1]|uniref:sugar phosphate isomerase/epimerase family protein n=1 Tax=Congregicoccus parvus TaxID=3081749 RepID=UPI002B313AD1|nr:hypothetical protein ASA1KI_15630 [Opitutales bacterium ASA1]